MSKRKTSISDSAAMMGKKGGEAGKGASKARTSEQARKANAASHEAKRKKKEQTQTAENNGQEKE